MLLAAVTGIGLAAQDMNSKADNIIGEYFTDYGGDESRIRISTEPGGTYKAQVFWCRTTHDKKGNLITDDKNPDKNLRSTPCDQIVLVTGLKYDNEKKRWDGGKIYDPTRGIKVNVSCTFTESKILKLRGTVFGIGETLFWIKEK